MKPQIFFAVAACALHAMSAEWVANPLSWTYDADSRTLKTDGTSPFAVADVSLAEDVRVEAEVRPEGAGTNGWATLGVAIHDDDRNFWHVALVRSPPEEGPERHTFELCEMRNGVWLSQGIDKLKCLRHVHKGTWKYGESYRMSLCLDRSSSVCGTYTRALGSTASHTACPCVLTVLRAKSLARLKTPLVKRCSRVHSRFLPQMPSCVAARRFIPLACSAARSSTRSSGVVSPSPRNESTCLLTRATAS